MTSTNTKMTINTTSVNLKKCLKPWKIGQYSILSNYDTRTYKRRYILMIYKTMSSFWNTSRLRKYCQRCTRIQSKKTLTMDIYRVFRCQRVLWLSVFCVWTTLVFNPYFFSPCMSKEPFLTKMHAVSKKGKCIVLLLILDTKWAFSTLTKLPWKTLNWGSLLNGARQQWLSKTIVSVTTTSLFTNAVSRAFLILTAVLWNILLEHCLCVLNNV